MKKILALFALTFSLSLVSFASNAEARRGRCYRPLHKDTVVHGATWRDRFGSRCSCLHGRIACGKPAPVLRTCYRPNFRDRVSHGAVWRGAKGLFCRCNKGVIVCRR